MPQLVEAVLLDMDGTQIITEPRNRRVNEITAKKHGGRIDKGDWAFLTGTSEKAIWTHLKDKFNDFAISEKDYIAEVEDGFIYDQVGVLVRPGIPEIFARAASRGIPVATVTNASHRMADHHLRSHGLNFGTTLIIAHDDVIAAGMRPKKHPDPYLLAAQRLGVNIKNCLIVEDAWNGAESAVTALGNEIKDNSPWSGRLIQIIDPDCETQFHPHAHAHAYDRDQLVAACYKFIP